MAKARPARGRKRPTRSRKAAAGSRKKTATKRPAVRARAKERRTTDASRAPAAPPAAERPRTSAPARRAPVPESPLVSAAAAVGRALGRTVEAVTRLPIGTPDHDALKLLETDHRRIETLLKDGEDTSDRAVATRSRLLETITTELQTHEEMEEKVLYPALKTHAEATASVLEGYQEHHVADILIRELHALAPDDERWGAKFKVLKENIEHHIQEEEGEMFRIARSVLSRAEREELGVRMEGIRKARR